MVQHSKYHGVMREYIIGYHYPIPLSGARRLDFWICCRAVRAAGWIFYLLRGGAGCGPDQCGAGRAAGQDMSKICGAGCGPNDTVAGRAQLFQPAQFLSNVCTLSVPISWWIT